MSDEMNNKKDKTMMIVGVNLIIMISYTLIVRTTLGLDGAFLLALMLAFHFILCLLIAPFIHGKAFVLSSLAVLLIGFSTCYLAYTIH